MNSRFVCIQRWREKYTIDFHLICDLHKLTKPISIHEKNFMILDKISTLFAQNTPK